MAGTGSTGRIRQKAVFPLLTDFSDQAQSISLPSDLKQERPPGVTREVLQWIACEKDQGLFSLLDPEERLCRAGERIGKRPDDHRLSGSRNRDPNLGFESLEVGISGDDIIPADARIEGQGELIVFSIVCEFRNGEFRRHASTDVKVVCRLRGA